MARLAGGRLAGGVLLGLALEKHAGQYISSKGIEWYIDDFSLKIIPRTPIPHETIYCLIQPIYAGKAEIRSIASCIIIESYM